MRLIELQEQAYVSYALEAEELADLQKGKWLDIRPSCDNRSQYDLNPGPYVGVVQLPTLTVRITPKLPAARVLFLWFYAADPKHWRDEQAPFKEAPDLVEAMAHAFVLELEKALLRGCTATA